MNKTLVIVGIILGIGGILFSLLPADVHMAIFGEDMPMDEGMNMNDGAMENMNSHHNHGVFITWGLVVAVIGLGAAFAGWKIFD